MISEVVALTLFLDLAYSTESWEIIHIFFPPNFTVPSFIAIKCNKQVKLHVKNATPLNEILNIIYIIFVPY